MVPWIAAAAAVFAAIAWVAWRRKTCRHASFREDLFEGLLPSAVTGTNGTTGTTGRRSSSDGWGLRWADVTNLTAGDLAGPPRRRAALPTASPAAEAPIEAAVGVTATARPPEPRPSPKP